MGEAMQRPETFTVDSLADRWKCSSGLVRKRIRAGELQHFRIGTLIRIREEDVRRYECRTIASNDSAEDTPSSGVTQPESDAGTPLLRPIGLERRQKRASAGGSGTVHRGPWEE